MKNQNALLEKFGVSKETVQLVCELICEKKEEDFCSGWLSKLTDSKYYFHDKHSDDEDYNLIIDLDDNEAVYTGDADPTINYYSEGAYINKMSYADKIIDQKESLYIAFEDGELEIEQSL